MENPKLPKKSRPWHELQSPVDSLSSGNIRGAESLIREIMDEAKISSTWIAHSSSSYCGGGD
jgi:hypothetical protein